MSPSQMAVSNALVPSSVKGSTYVIDLRLDTGEAIESELSGVAVLQSISPTFHVVLISDRPIFAETRPFSWPVEHVMPRYLAAATFGASQATKYLNDRLSHVLREYANSRYLTLDSEAPPGEKLHQVIARYEGCSNPILDGYLNNVVAMRNSPRGRAGDGGMYHVGDDEQVANIRYLTSPSDPNGLILIEYAADSDLASDLHFDAEQRREFLVLAIGYREGASERSVHDLHAMAAGMLPEKLALRFCSKTLRDSIGNFGSQFDTVTYFDDDISSEALASLIDNSLHQLALRIALGD